MMMTMMLQFADLEIVKPKSPRGVQLPAPTSGPAKEDQLRSVLRSLARKVKSHVENDDHQALIRLFGRIGGAAALQKALAAVDDRKPPPGTACELQAAVIKEESQEETKKTSSQTAVSKDRERAKEEALASEELPSIDGDDVSEQAERRSFSPTRPIEVQSEFADDMGCDFGDRPNDSRSRSSSPSVAKR